jgi:hypothetical protein
VADRSRYQRTIEAWVHLARQQFRRPRQEKRRLYALAETPFFVDSLSTRLMQLSDLVAYAFYRGYSAGDWDWANGLILEVIAANPKRLVHLTGEKECSCPACAKTA